MAPVFGYYYLSMPEVVVRVGPSSPPDKRLLSGILHQADFGQGSFLVN